MDSRIGLMRDTDEQDQTARLCHPIERGADACRFVLQMAAEELGCPSTDGRQRV
jgi:hypothetical protein